MGRSPSANTRACWLEEPHPPPNARKQKMWSSDFVCYDHSDVSPYTSNRTTILDERLQIVLIAYIYIALVFWTLCLDLAWMMLKTPMICFLDYLGMAGQFKLRQSGI